ncbi:MAG: hypothetical protein ABJL44_07900 [Algibacter sp.]
MKKLSLKNLKLETSDLLKRKQLKTVFGGNYGDGCQIAVSDSNGNFSYWSDAIYSVSEAQSAYNNNTHYSDGSQATGYCCASC